MKTTGSIPTAGLIKLNFEEYIWDTFAKGLMKDLTLSGQIERTPGVWCMIKIKVIRIYSPSTQKYKSTLDVRGVNQEENSKYKSGLERAADVILEKYVNTRWLLLGQIEGGIPKSIAIIHFPVVNESSYSIKRPDEELNDFLPEGAQYNPN